MRAVKQQKTVLDVSDDQVLAHLRGHRGRGMASDKIAAYFGVSASSMRYTMARLVNDKGVRERSVNGHRLFYIPGAEDLERGQASKVVYAFPEYKMPKAMRDRLESIRAERDRFPSRF